MKRLVIIDGKSVFYRGYYAMGSLSLSDGTPTGGVFGFTSLAFEVIRKLKPDYVVVAWDKKGTSISRRLEIFDGYKAGRKKAPDDFYTQIPILHNFLKTLGWPLFECDGYEADDILGTLSRQSNSLGIESCLITSDLDMLQLIDNNTKVFAMKKGFSTIEEFDLAYFEEKYGLKQAQFLDLKALQGDSSDNIPGVSGIGPKTATSLLQEFFTLEGIYENIEKIKPSIRKKLESGKESAFMSKKLAEIWLDAPVELNLEQADIKNFNYKSVLEILKKLEFNSLVRKIPQEMKSNNSDEKNQINIFDNLNDDFNLEIIPDGNIDNILLSRDIFIDFENDIFTLSNGETISSLPKNSWKKINENIKNKRFIFFNSKNTFHKIDNKKIQLNFEEIYDIQQMEFLLNPLIRDKSINGILNQEINEENPKEKISALVNIFNKQQEKLKTLPQIKKIAKELDFPLSKVIFKMEKEGVKINQEFFKEISQEFSKKIETLQSEIWEITEKEFNIASPLQLSKVLFEDLKLPTKGIKKSKTGFSTDQKTLDKLRDVHPVISKIEQFREFSKIKNTYIDALPKLADENDRIHTTFHQDITTTGRLSSSNPNLQNIPIRSEIGRKIRTGFIAEKGKVLVTADYSQFELRLAAVMSGDKKMIDDFNSGSDIHSKTASEMFKVSIENITPEQRRAAKVINFGVLYGMSAHRLATELKTSFTEAKKFIENYFEVRKPIANFIASTILQAEEQGFVETMFGRRRPTPDIKSSNFIIRESAKRAAANMPIQGTEADLMKKAMLSIDKEITQKNLGKQILQIHDSILIETTPEKSKKVAEILKREMENICPELKIKLQVDVKIGKNWAEI